MGCCNLQLSNTSSNRFIKCNPFSTFNRKISPYFIECTSVVYTHEISFKKLITYSSFFKDWLFSFNTTSSSLWKFGNNFGIYEQFWCFSWFGQSICCHLDYEKS